MVSQRVINQLEQFAFERARVWARQEVMSPEDSELIDALADSYGDSGWFQGSQAVIVYAALTTLGVKIE